MQAASVRSCESHRETTGCFRAQWWGGYRSGEACLLPSEEASGFWNVTFLGGQSGSSLTEGLPPPQKTVPSNVGNLDI